MPGHRRRVRVGQDDDRAVGHAPAAVRRRDHPRPDLSGRDRDHGAVGGGDAAGPGQCGRDGVPGSADVAEPDDDDRRPDRRVGAAAPQRGQGGRPRARGRGARPGRHAPSGRTGRQLPAPALGRHAPARDDRDGAGLRAETADRGRADHRARRHHPEADPRAARRPAPAPGHGRHPGHPRPGRDRGPRGPGRGHVRRADRGDGAGPGDVRPPAPPLHRGAARRAAGEGGRRRPALQHPRPAAGPDGPVARVPVRAPLPARA